MLKSYKICERRPPLATQLGYFFKKIKEKITKRAIKKISAIFLPLLLTNAALSIFLPFPKINIGASESECIMELTKTDESDPVEPGEDLQYRLVLKNTGTKVCTGGGVKLKEFYNEKTIFVSSIPQPTQGNNLWNFGDVFPGETHEVNITVKVSNTAKDGDEIINKACFWTREYDRWVCVEEKTIVQIPLSPPPPETCENPITFDFESDAAAHALQTGQIIDEEFLPYGISVTAQNNNPSHPQKAIIFDSAHPTGGVNGDQIRDIDLGTPNKKFGGPGDSETGDGAEDSNNIALFNILIIPDNEADTNPADGFIDDPNDEPSGGSIHLAFSRPYAFVSARYIDLDHNFGEVAGFSDSAGTQAMFSLPISKGNGNSVKKVTGDGITEIQHLKISARDSFGIDNIILCPKEIPPLCGNSIREAGEDCDNGQDNGTICEPEYAKTCSYCSGTCRLVALNGEQCGDNVKNGPEECDGTDGAGQGQTCTDQCTFIPLPPPAPTPTPTPIPAPTPAQPTCGDGTINQAQEQCDDGNTSSGDGCSLTCQAEALPPPPCTNCGGGGGGGGGGVIPRTPRLLLAKRASVFHICSGNSFEYAISVTNIGNETGKNLVLSDTLPQNFLLETNSQNSFTENLGDIASYETKTYTYAVKVAQDATEGIYKNSATASIDNGHMENRSVSASAEVKILGACETSKAQAPVLTIEKKASAPFINPGGAFEFTITLKNTGNGAAFAVGVNDILPDGFLPVNNITAWDLGDMEPNETRAITFAVKTGADIAPRTYTNIARARASNHNEISAEANIEVRRGEILGAEFKELPNTGMGTQMAVYFSANIFALFFGIFLYRKTREYEFI